MMPAHITRLMTFAQHGEPKGYAASDMMRADLEVLILGAAYKGQPARAIASELRTHPTAQPAQPVAEKYVEGFLCRAWGETDFPEVALARTREEIIAFILQAQYGDTPLAELYEENRQIIEEQIAAMDLDVASCDARWQIEFEIGGISVERVTFLAPVSGGLQVQEDAPL